MSSINVNTIKSRLGGPPTLPSGVVVSAAATFSSDVSIGGTLTYEDVTNVDVVGLITARSGIELGAAGVGGTIRANGDTTLAGVVTATSFSGAATGLTGVPGGQITGALAAVDGSALTGMANTANVNTAGLNVIGIATVGTALTLGDNVHARFGNAGDLKIYHDSGGQSRIEESGSSVLKIMGSDLRLSNTGNTADYIQANDGAEVNLYFNGSKKFETHNTGIRVTGIATVTSTIYVNTNGSSLAENNLNFASSGKAYIDHRTTSQDIDFRVSHGSALDRTAITIGSAGVSTFYDTPHDDLGYMRNVPLNTQAGTYDLVAADSGKTILASNTVTFNTGEFDGGDVVTIINNTNGNITITQGSGAAMYWTADGTTGSRTLGTRGMASIYFTHNTTGYIGGAGLT